MHVETSKMHYYDIHNGTSGPCSELVQENGSKTAGWEVVAALVEDDGCVGGTRF